MLFLRYLICGDGAVFLLFWSHFVRSYRWKQQRRDFIHSRTIYNTRKEKRNPQNRNYYNPSYSLWFNLNHKFTIINYFPLKRTTEHGNGSNLAQIKCTTVLFRFFCFKKWQFLFLVGEMTISIFGKRNDNFLELLDFKMSNQYPSILWLLSNNKYPYCRAHLPFLIWNHAKMI